MALRGPDVFAAFVFQNACGAIRVSELQGHRQSRFAERPTVCGKLALLGFVVAFLREGHGSEAIVGVIFPAKIGINVPGVKRRIEGRVAWPVAEALFRLLHQWEEVSDIGVIEGLGQFRDDELAQIWRLGDNDARAITPIVFADLRLLSGNGVAGRCGRRRTAIMTAFAAQATIGIAYGLLLLVKALGDVRFGIVLLDPGQNMVRRTTAERILRNATQVEERRHL